MITQARGNVLKAGLPAESIQFILGDITNLPAISSLAGRRFDAIISLWAFSSTLPITQTATLQQWRTFLSPSLGRILIDHAHPDKAAAGFVSHDLEGKWKQFFVICEAQRYIECERDLYSTAAVAGLEVIQSSRYDQSENLPTATDRLEDILSFAQKKWTDTENTGAPDIGSVEERRRQVLEKWKKQAIAKGWKPNHRLVSIAGLLR